MASIDYKFTGWVAHDASSINGTMRWEEYQVKPWTEDDIDIKIEACGMCGSECHTLRSGWGKTNYPVVVGHEIVGRAVRVGSQSEGSIAIGDRVGVGAQSSSCLQPDCENCSNHLENHCRRVQVNTYAAFYPDGSKSMGGYARYCRVPSHFVVKIPEALASIDAAPMLCGGVTTYTPLIENGAGPGKKVGVVGIGGLGHFALIFAQALGCTEITAVSRTSSKKEDAMKMGATKFIATSEDDRWWKVHAASLDLIICTVSSHDLPLTGYLGLLRTGGQFIMVGVPEDKLPGFNIGHLISKKAKIGGSAIGSPRQIREMLDLAARKKLKPWVQPRPMSDANNAIQDLENGKPRYRYVLVNPQSERHGKL